MGENNKYGVLIIGAGSIGALKPYELDNKNSKYPLTWAHAVFMDNDMELIGITDEDKDKADRAGKKWDCRGLPLWGVCSNYKYIQELKPDIVIVATPDNSHFPILLDAVKGSYIPKAVIAEKPFCDSYVKAVLVEELYNERKVPLLVNYSRRFVPGIIELKLNIQASYKKYEYEGLGKALNARVIYSRGIRREGSHALDLLHYFFGKCIDAEVYINSIVEDLKGEKTVCTRFSFERCPQVFFSAIDGRSCYTFEIDMLFERGRVRMVDGCKNIIYYIPRKEEIYGHYSTIKEDMYTRVDTELEHSLEFALNNLKESIERGVPLRCSFEEAKAVQKIYDYLGV